MTCNYALRVNFHINQKQYIFSVVSSFLINTTNGDYTFLSSTIHVIKYFMDCERYIIKLDVKYCNLYLNASQT